MRKHIIIILLFLAAGTAVSQDYIYRKNGNIAKVKIIDIDSTTITYKTFFNGESVMSFIQRDQVLRYESKKYNRYKKLLALDPLVDIDSVRIVHETSKSNANKKVEYVLSGNIGFSYDEHYDEDGTEVSSNFIVVPNFAIRIKKQHEVGGGIGYSYTKTQYPSVRRNTDENIDIQKILYFNSYYRYYITKNDLKLYLGPKLSIGDGTLEFNDGDPIEFSITGISFDIGATYRLYDNFELDFGLGMLDAQMQTVTYEDYSGTKSDTYLRFNNFLSTQSLSLGVRLLF